MSVVLTVWNLQNGDIVEKNWDATEEDYIDLQSKYADEPLYSVEMEVE